MIYFKIISIKWHLMFLLPIMYFVKGEIEDGMMKAVVLNDFGDPELLHIEQMKIPEILRGQMLIKVMAAGINPVDAYIRAARYPRIPELPTVLGKEISGIVKEIWNTTECMFQKEQSVFCGITNGGYAEFAVANISSCYPLGDKLSFTEGAAIYLIYLAAYRALVTKAHIKTNETILVYGDNAHIANAAVQVAKSIGCYVVACVGERVVSELNKRNQSDYVVDRSTPDVLGPILEKLGKSGFDIIFESTTNANITQDRFYLDPTNGRLLVMGNRNISKGGRILGSNVISFSFNRYTKEEEMAASQFFLDGVQNGWISPIIGQTYALDDASGAHKDILSSKSTRGTSLLPL